MRRAIAGILAVSLSMASLLQATAHAGLIGADAVALATGTSEQLRSEVRRSLLRDDVKIMLEARGVNPAMLDARVAAMTDAELNELADRMDELPAGGDSLVGAAVFVFLVLLVTDLLGLTDVFPFVKKAAR